MTSGYSRMRWAVMIPSRTAPDLIAGHWALIQAIGAVTRQLDMRPTVVMPAPGSPQTSRHKGSDCGLSPSQADSPPTQVTHSARRYSSVRMVVDNAAAYQCQ